MSAKLVGFWIGGGISLLIGVWIINNLEFEVGVSVFSYLFALIIAFILFLVTGLCWISVAVATRHKI